MGLRQRLGPELQQRLGMSVGVGSWTAAEQRFGPAVVGSDAGMPRAFVPSVGCGKSASDQELF